MKHIVTLSGGQDSTSMLIRMLELGMQVDYILFCDTSVEFDVMYCYIDYIDEYIQKNYNKKITRLKSKYNFEDLVKRPLGDRAKAERIGKPKGIPRVIGMDICTRELKVNQIKKFVNDLEEDVLYYNGYTYNEVLKNRGSAKERLKENYRYPLYDWKWNELQIAEYLKSKKLFNPLYQHYTRTGCYLCPKQSLKSWFNLWKHYNHHFEYAKKLEEWCINNDAVSNHFVYRRVSKDAYEWVSLCTLEEEFKIKDKQKTFDFDLDENEISCLCK